MIRVGLTGGIGSGKSTVAKILEAKGYPVFYSDDEAKAIVVENSAVKAEITELLGDDAYIDGVYNRAYVGQLVFNDKNLLNGLNQIIHPAVREAFDNFSKSQIKNIIFNEAAILFETGGSTSFDFNVLVCSPIELRLERIMQRDGASKGEVLARMNKQWSDAKKRELADYVIENNEQDSLLLQIDELVQKLTLRHP